MTAAVKAWNELVEHGLIQSGHLNPAQGDLIADPNFKFGIQPQPHVFGWHVSEVPGVFVSAPAGSLALTVVMV